MKIGHRVLVEAQLEPEENGGLRGPMRQGHRSVAYRFAGLGGEADQGFGALVEEVLEGGEPGGRLVAKLRFYHDLADVYATPGAEFDVWYGRAVGRGRVLEILGDSGCQE